MRIYIACTVRLGENQKAREWREELERAGHKVHYPPKDTKQETENNGLDICTANYKAIKWADEIHVFYDARSQGIHFDCGIAFALGKVIKVISVEEEMSSHYSPSAQRKSFAKMLQTYETSGGRVGSSR